MFPSQDGKAPQSLPGPGQSVTVKDPLVLLMFGCSIGGQMHCGNGVPSPSRKVSLCLHWVSYRSSGFGSGEGNCAGHLRMIPGLCRWGTCISSGTSAQGCVQWSSVQPWLSERKEGAGMEHGGWASLPGSLWGPLVLLLLSGSDTPGCLWDSAWCCQSRLRQSIGSKRASAFIYWKTKDYLGSCFLFALCLWCMHLQNTFSY